MNPNEGIRDARPDNSKPSDSGSPAPKKQDQSTEPEKKDEQEKEDTSGLIAHEDYPRGNSGNSGRPPDDGTGPVGPNVMPADDGTGPVGPNVDAADDGTGPVGPNVMPADDGTGPVGPNSRVSRNLVCGIEYDTSCWKFGWQKPQSLCGRNLFKILILYSFFLLFVCSSA